MNKIKDLILAVLIVSIIIGLFTVGSTLGVLLAPIMLVGFLVFIVYMVLQESRKPK